MPKKRSARNRGLPKRWNFHHGGYYYLVPPGHESRWDGKRRFLLGRTLPDAYRAWAERIEQVDAARTVAQLLDRYAMEHVPTLARKTQRSRGISMRKLRVAFGHMSIDTVREVL